MTTVVLVHGGWGGGYAWQHVARRLRAAGHEVYTPTLTGLGERVHLATPRVDLGTHITDVVNLLEAEDLAAVALAGHSYGGMVITGVAQRVPQRLAELIYLDAFVPRDGDALLDLLAPQARADTEDSLRRSDDGWGVLWPGDHDTPRPWPPSTPHFSPQSWLTFSQPLRGTNPAAVALPRTYVRCTADKQPNEFMALALDGSFARAQAEGWPVRVLEGDHGAPTEEAGAALLLDLLSPPGPR